MQTSNIEHRTPNIEHRISEKDWEPRKRTGAWRG